MEKYYQEVSARLRASLICDVHSPINIEWAWVTSKGHFATISGRTYFGETYNELIDSINNKNKE